MRLLSLLLLAASNARGARLERGDAPPAPRPSFSPFSPFDETYAHGITRGKSLSFLAKDIISADLPTMYVVRELEDAIDDCVTGCIDCNCTSAHAWDEAVAFCTGSLEGETGISQFGHRTGAIVKLLYALADKRAENFKSAGVLGESVSGGAKVDHEIFSLFDGGQKWLLNSECRKVRPILQEIVKCMATPLLQGTLRYAHKVGVGSNDRPKNKAEGAVFAASVLPLAYTCSKDDAKVIYDNMKIGATSTNQPADLALWRRLAISGLPSGGKAARLFVIVLAIVLFLSTVSMAALCGFHGVAVSDVGMLSTFVTSSAIDAHGPAREHHTTIATTRRGRCEVKCTRGTRTRKTALVLVLACFSQGPSVQFARMNTTIVTLLCTAAFANAFGSTAKDRPTFSDIWVRNTLADPARFDGWYAQGRQGLTEYTSYTFTAPPGVQYPYMHNPVYSMLYIEQFTYTETVTKGTTPPVNRSDLFENSFWTEFWTEFTFPDTFTFPDFFKNPMAIAGKTLIEFLGGLGLHYNYDFTTDGFLVMIDGKTVFEDYWGMQTVTSRHMLYSGTKSYCGIMAAMLVADGSLNASAFVTDIVPALQGSGYEGATVRQVMDMTAAIQWEEDLPSCGSGDPLVIEELWSTVRAALEAGEEIPIVEGCEQVQYHWVNGLVKILPSVIYEYFEGKTFTPPGPTTIQDFLTRIKPHQEQNHGEAFTYRTGHTDTLAWIVNETVVSKLGYTRPTDYFSKKIWSQLGQVADAYFVTDYSRVPYFGSGASVTLRDYANFGEMLRMDGKNKEGEEVVKEEVVADLFNPKEDPPPTASGIPGLAYRNQFWKYGEAVIQLGFYGQWVYIHKGHGCVVAKHSHDPCFWHGCPGTAQPNGLPDYIQTMHAFEYICAQASSHAASRGSG